MSANKAPRLKRNSRQDMADSVRSLAMMLSVQHGELTPLQTLSMQYAGTKLGKAYDNVAYEVTEGTPFAEALAAEEHFPDIVRRTVTVGARTGDVAGHLTQAADLLDEQIDTSGKVRSALLEPAIIGSAVIIFFAAMVVFALPRMVEVFTSMGAETPPLTRLALLIAQVGQFLVPALAAIAAGTLVWWHRAGRHNVKVRLALDRFMLRLPGVGALQREAALAASMRVLATMSHLGVPEREALEAAAAASPNRVIAELLRDHGDAITRGDTTFPEISDGKYIPFAVSSVLKAASTSGALGTGLDHIAATFRRSAHLRADNLATVLGPMANLVVGATFAAVVLIVYLPMYSMFQALSAF